MTTGKKHLNVVLLNNYLENRCTPLERQYAEAHLSRCGICREKLELERTMNGLLDEMPVLQPSADLTDRIMQSIASGADRTASPYEQTASNSRGGKYSRIKVEFMHGMIALAGTYMFIASGTLSRIGHISQLGVTMQQTVSQSMSYSVDLLVELTSAIGKLM